MTLFLHELKQGRNMLIIWTAVVAFMLAVCIFLYPEMETQMSEVGGMFSNMGSFSAAFGMDKLNFGEFMGYFGVECGNVLGLGGAFFSALLGTLALAKEEKEQTAEFLLTHPLSRSQIVLQKLCAVFFQILLFTITVIATVSLSILFIGEKPDIKDLALLFLAYFILQVECAAICFAISAFLRQSGFGLGIGIAAAFYFLNIIANLTEKASFLKYITPFGYTDSSEILTNDRIPLPYLSVGLLFTFLGIIIAFYQYSKKDIS